MLDKDSILIGYSGHAFVVAETALENETFIIGYSEKREVKLNPFNLKYLGCENVVFNFAQLDHELELAERHLGSAIRPHKVFDVFGGVQLFGLAMLHQFYGTEGPDTK